MENMKNNHAQTQHELEKTKQQVKTQEEGNRMVHETLETTTKHMAIAQENLNQAAKQNAELTQQLHDIKQQQQTIQTETR